MQKVVKWEASKWGSILHHAWLFTSLFYFSFLLPMPIVFTPRAHDKDSPNKTSENRTSGLIVKIGNGTVLDFRFRLSNFKCFIGWKGIFWVLIVSQLTFVKNQCIFISGYSCHQHSCECTADKWIWNLTDIIHFLYLNI